MSKVIIFRCKNCNEIFFAAIKDKKIIKDSKKEIIQYLSEGHRMEEIDLERTKVTLGNCNCSELEE